MTEHDIYLFKEGTHARLYEKFGCHLDERDGVAGARFAVWAPNARRVAVIGEWNGWNPDVHPLALREDGSGVWEGFVPGVVQGQAYKYRIESRFGDYRVDKADPFAFFSERPPHTGSRAWKIEYAWGDAAYQGQTDIIKRCAPKARDMTHRRCRRKGVVDEIERAKNRNESRVRAKVEHAIGVIKNIFGFVKVRYKGLMKNANRSFAPCALANLYLARHHLLRSRGASCVQ